MIKLSNKNMLIVLASLAIVVSVLVVYMQLGFTKPESYESEIQKIETQSKSDDINAIENDLQNTELEDIDTEIKDIEQEFESL